MGTDLDTLGHRGACGGGVLRGSRAQWRYVEDREVPAPVKVGNQLRYYYIDNCDNKPGAPRYRSGPCGLKGRGEE